ncbi:hypothetical protein CVT24_013151, partial [Panaeolus cyanescens]
RPHLGYDTCVTRLEDGNYVYKIPSPLGVDEEDRFYRTVASLHELRRDTITGHAPRVWKVVRVRSKHDLTAFGGKEEWSVLKQVWIRDGSRTERDIQDAIWKDMEDTWKATSGECAEKVNEIRKRFPIIDKLMMNESYKRYFLTIDADAVGGYLTPKPAPFSGTTIRMSDSSIYSFSQSTNARTRGFKQKRQYSVVFKELCTTVGRLKTLGDTMDVLEDSVVGLLLLFCAGWVHRDLSTGNIMAYETGNKLQVKLCDLEYAQRFGKGEGSNDPKTGTPYFTALDVMRGDWNISLFSYIAPNKDLPRFFYTYRHDLESLWWITDFIAIVRLPYLPANKFAPSIFYNSMDFRPARDGFFHRAEQQLKPILDPRISFFANHLGDLARALHSLSTKLIANGDHNYDLGYLAIYEKFWHFFKVLSREGTEWRQLTLSKYGEQTGPGDHHHEDTLAPNPNDAPGTTTTPIHSLSPDHPTTTSHRGSKRKGNAAPISEPKRAKKSTTEKFKSNHLLACHGASEMNVDVITCKLEDFIQVYLPRPDDTLVNKCIDELVSAQLMDGDRLTAFAESLSEQTFSRGLEEICRELEDKSRSTYFEVCLNQVVKGCAEGWDNKIDGCIRYNKESGRLHVWDIAVVFLFTAEGGPENYLK